MTTWILSWDNIGLEAVVNWSEQQSNYVEASLKDEHAANPIYSIINMLQMRARFNPHRNPEIYAINMEDGLTEKDIRNVFETSGDSFKQLIREKSHYKIW